MLTNLIYRGKDKIPNLRSRWVKPKDALPDTLYEGKNTLVDNLEYVVEKSKDRSLYTLRKVVKEHVERDVSTGKEFITYEYGKNITVTYGEYWQMLQAYATGIKELAGETKRIGLFLNTSMEWMMSLHACAMNNIPSVTMYSNMGPNEVSAIVNEAELEVIVCEKMCFQTLKEIQEKCPKLKKLIISGGLKKVGDYECVTVRQVVEMGTKEKYEFPNKPKPEDVAVIMYTSGTTGTPKGVILTHEAIVAAICGFQMALKLNENTVYISYLPMAHIFELAVHNLAILTCCQIGFANPRTLLAKPGGAKFIGDIANIKPTFMCGVPRVWETIRKAVESKVRQASSVKQLLFNTIKNKKIRNLKKGVDPKVTLEDKIYKNVRNLFGGRLNLLVSGGAPISGETQLWLKAALGSECAVIQGYGLTETCAASTLQYPIDNRNGKYQPVMSTGCPAPCVEIRLESVPEMNYSIRDNPPQGEILIKSKACAIGYFKRPDLTKEVFKNGYFYTGDIGQINENGTLSIIDRKKNLQKLENGEYIALEHLESIYANSAFIQPNGLMVACSSFHNYICGIVLADKSYLAEWKKINEVNEKDEVVIRSTAYKKDVLESLRVIAEQMKKAKYEYIKDIEVFLGEWGPSDDTTTPSFKLKRRVLKEKYKDAINKLLPSGEEVVKTEVVEEKKEIEVKEKENTFPSFFNAINSSM